MAPNDDLSSSQISIPFVFDLFGALFNTLFINNNGNLSFGSPFGAYTSTGFPVSGYPMVAAFWADVDTRNGLGQVWMKQISSNVLAVAWDQVGYYAVQGDKLNTFMIMISDGNDSSMGVGNSVCFCYEDMQWTTGSASGGVGGFGGTPATVGANKGDGMAYYALGRYDAPGDGIQGIDLLDGQTICFTTSNTNQPPVAVGVPQDNSFDLQCDGFITDHIITFSGPEGDQLVDLEVTTTGDISDLVLNIDDSKQTASLTINWTPSLPGTVQLIITATDNGIHGTGTDPKTTELGLNLNYPGPCNSPPIALCQDIKIEATSACQASLSEQELISLIDAGSYDSDGDAITMSAAYDSPFDIGNQVVLLTVTDIYDATDSCESTITVIDNEVPTVDCGDVGVIAPCQVPVKLNFGPMSKANGCPVDIEVIHKKCIFCNGAGKETSRDCVIDGSTIIDSGGVQDHISWAVIATNVHIGESTQLSTEEVCTVCVQNPSADFDPGCSGNGAVTKKNGQKYACEASCPQCELHCSSS
eukprot:CCRYP_011290-RB/>CCRYP_011290-RB protein AED:0.01 eAED:0.01 QI:1437/1/1/1/0.66/0.25/4/197/528